MYRMAVLAMCTSDATFDVSKSVLLPRFTRLLTNFIQVCDDVRRA